MEIKPIALPLTIERQLERYASAVQHSQRHEILWHTWYQNKQWIMQLLEGIALSFPMYSRHDESHAQTILHSIELILGEDRIACLSATDCFILLHTVYIHDIGMMITADERKEIVTSKRFSRMLDELYESGDKVLMNAVKAIKRTDYRHDNLSKHEAEKKLYEEKLDVYYALIQLIAQHRRSDHGDETKKRLYKWVKDPDKLGTGLSLSGIPQRIFFTIAECARMHTESGFWRINELVQEDDGYVFDYMHPRFVSVLLQLNQRRRLYDRKGDTSWHYQKHLSIRKLHITPDSIEITADCDNQMALRLVRRETDMLTDILKQAGYHWAKIRPKDFPGALPFLSSVELFLRGKKIPQELVEAKFEISQKKAFDIIEGSNLYEHRFTFLREFLQNALDATKLQYWKECIGTAEYHKKRQDGKSVSPYDLEQCVTTAHFPIRIRMEAYERKGDSYKKIFMNLKNSTENLDPETTYGVMVAIKDFGTGISQDSIRAISEVGTSIDKKDSRIQEMPEWLRPTGEFGVGLQSAFLVTDSFSCVTHTRTEERYRIIFNSRSLSHYDGYINVSPVKEFSGEDDTYGTRFEVFVPIEKKMPHEMAPASWDGEDIFSENYERLRPFRHIAELISQMALYLDSLVGNVSLFPLYLELVKMRNINIPINTNERNKIRFMKLEWSESKND